MENGKQGKLSITGEESEIRIARRGIDSDDYKWFSEKEILKLQHAQQEVLWLLNRGYRIKPIIQLVASHYQLSARQNLALQRATCTSIKSKERDLKRLPESAVSERMVYIDGFNLIISLEVALSGGILILGNDGTIRDLAGLRGTYRIIDKTIKALELIGKAIEDLNLTEVKFYLDAPVSNSGRLKTKILEQSEKWNIPVEVELHSNPDIILKQLDRVITSDSEILDSCISWFNMARWIIEKYVKDANTIELTKN